MHAAKCPDAGFLVVAHTVVSWGLGKEYRADAEHKTGHYLESKGGTPRRIALASTAVGTKVGVRNVR